MLTPLLTDNDESNGPNDTKRGNNYEKNYNFYNEKDINNKNINFRKNIIPKKRKII